MTTQNTTYNGWTNYETWNVKLWMDNDEGASNYWREVAQETYNEAEAGDVLTRDEKAAFTLADALKQWHEDAMPELEASCWSDLLRAALSEVNWDEIAENLLEEVDKDESDEADDE